MRQIPVYHKGQVTQWAKVDDADYESLAAFKWNLLIPPHSDLRYAVRTEQVEGHQVATLMHRQIANPEHRVEVDHKDRDGLNNCRDNLRTVSHASNMQNRKATVGTSAFRGVAWDTRKQRWQARGQLNGRRYHVGYFLSESAANLAAINWRRANMPFSADAA